MSRPLTPRPLTSALAAALLAAAAPAPAAAAAGGTTGVVLGVEGKAYAHAKVCIDRNRNARCDAGETAVFSGADGGFRLAGRGAVVAEVGKGAFLVDTVAHTRVAVRQALVLRAPADAAAGPRAVGPLSSELQAIVDANGRDRSLADAERQLRARLGLADADATGAAPGHSM
jgi:acid phosphatase